MNPSTSTNAKRFDIRVLAGLCVAALIAVGSLTTAAAARPAALRKCGTVHVRALRPAGYTTERLFVTRGTSCAKGRRDVQKYYTSHTPCQGSGCFRTIGNLNCGGGQSSNLGGVALRCNPRSDPSVVIIELRVRSKPPPPSLPTDRGTRSTGASEPRAHAARACGSIRINYRPTPSEHYTRMYITAPRSLACATALRVMRRYRDDRERCSGSSCFRFYRDGWTCDAVTPGDWPVIQECYRHTHRIRVVGRVHSAIRGPR